MVIVMGPTPPGTGVIARSEEHTSELQSQSNLVCRLLLEKKKTIAPEHALCDTATVVTLLAALGRQLTPHVIRPAPAPNVCPARFSTFPITRTLHMSAEYV